MIIKRFENGIEIDGTSTHISVVNEDFAIKVEDFKVQRITGGVYYNFSSEKQRRDFYITNGLKYKKLSRFICWLVNVL